MSTVFALTLRQIFCGKPYAARFVASKERFRPLRRRFSICRSTVFDGSPFKGAFCRLHAAGEGRGKGRTRNRAKGGNKAERQHNDRATAGQKVWNGWGGRARIKRRTERSKRQSDDKAAAGQRAGQRLNAGRNKRRNKIAAGAAAAFSAARLCRSNDTAGTAHLSRGNDTAGAAHLCRGNDTAGTAHLSRGNDTAGAAHLCRRNDTAGAAEISAAFFDFAV